MALGAAGLLYARERNIPAWAALPVLAAFLLEFSLYLVAGFESARERLETALPPLPLAFCLAGSALLPYLVYSLGTHLFHWDSLLRLAALALMLSLWYIVLPPSGLVDAIFLLLVAAVILRKFFDSIFLDPLPNLHVEILGQLMLIHLAALVMLIYRRVAGMRYGFLPSRQEWRIGLVNFLWFLPVGLPLALATRLIQSTPGEFSLWKTAATFFGILWVVALSEEFLFRGLLQRWIGEWTGSPAAALVLASVIFGLCHLWFRAFPNWRFALVAAVAGAFYGRAFNQANSIRAGMVTHALVVTLWRTVLS